MKNPVNPQKLTNDLGGQWHVTYGNAPCPICQPERRNDQNALSITVNNGKLLLNCLKSGCSFLELLTVTGLRNQKFDIDDEALRIAAKDRRRQNDQKSRKAKEIWLDTVDVAGTAAEMYLRQRAINCELPTSLRFHPACWHGPAKKRYPAMIARVDGGEGFAIHRTYLTPEGQKAEIVPNKMMLGSTAGGAVHLCDGGGPLFVAEGIETALSLACGIAQSSAIIWAALSTSGMTSLKLPPFPHAITIAPDADKAGQSAAYNLAARADGLGWNVSILNPPYGSDWNDVLVHEHRKM